MSDDVKALIARLRLSQNSYGKTMGMRELFGEAADALEAAQRAPAVDREALARLLHKQEGDPRFDWKDFMPQVAEIIASGILQDAAVDREALAAEIRKAASYGQYQMPGDSLPYEQWSLTMAASLIQSGIFRESRPEHVVKAEALEEFAWQCDDDWGEFAYNDASGMIRYATVPEMANERAQQLRESTPEVPNEGNTTNG